MKLYVVPTNQVQRFWYLAEPLLQKALDKGNNEYTADQLKLLVTQGQQQLLLVMKEDKCYVAVTVQFINYPNDRVAYITYIGGKNTRAGFEQFKQWAKEQGCTAIQGSTKYESIARLWNRLYGYEKKYQLMELKLE
tara:strand:+ start:1302 stop:1709 length:408 start_codon:yes stop_codon:yes gene_type:complete